MGTNVESLRAQAPDPLPFHTNFRKFMKMIGKLSFSVDLVGLIGKIIIDIRCAAR